MREVDPEDDRTTDAGSSTTELPDVASSSSAAPLSAAPASGGTTGGAGTGGASTGGAAGASNIGLIKITIPVEAAIVRAIGGALYWCVVSKWGRFWRSGCCAGAYDAESVDGGS